MKNHKKNFFNQKWYSNYIHDHYKNKDNLRDSILNKEVLFQHLARKKCLVNSLSKLSLDKDISKIIDIGFGSCSDLINLVSFGFKKTYMVLTLTNQTSILEGEIIRF